MSNPSSTSVVALRDSNGGNGVFVPRNSFETFVGGAEKTSHPTPTPAPKTTIATTATMTTETPFAPRIASTGGALPPAAMTGANAPPYLNVTGPRRGDQAPNHVATWRYDVAARLKHPSSTSRPASRTSFGLFIAGMYRTDDSPHGNRIRPCSYASPSLASRILASAFFDCLDTTNSVACIIPRPRRSPMNSYRSFISSKRLAM